jgi:hypothetical protein
MTDRVLTL